MSRTIELPDDVFASIEQEASAEGVSVADMIARYFPGRMGDSPKTLFERMKAGIGSAHSGQTGEAASERSGEIWRQDLERKRAEGRL